MTDFDVVWPLQNTRAAILSSIAQLIEDRVRIKTYYGTAGTVKVMKLRLDAIHSEYMTIDAHDGQLIILTHYNDKMDLATWESRRCDEKRLDLADPQSLPAMLRIVRKYKAEMEIPELSEYSWV